MRDGRLCGHGDGITRNQLGDAGGIVARVATHAARDAWDVARDTVDGIRRMGERRAGGIAVVAITAVITIVADVVGPGRDRRGVVTGTSLALLAAGIVSEIPRAASQLRRADGADHRRIAWTGAGAGAAVRGRGRTSRSSARRRGAGRGGAGAARERRGHRRVRGGHQQSRRSRARRSSADLAVGDLSTCWSTTRARSLRAAAARDRRRLRAEHGRPLLRSAPFDSRRRAAHAPPGRRPHRQHRASIGGKVAIPHLLRIARASSRSSVCRMVYGARAGSHRGDDGPARIDAHWLAFERPFPRASSPRVRVVRAGGCAAVDVDGRRSGGREDHRRRAPEARAPDDLDSGQDAGLARHDGAGARRIRERRRQSRAAGAAGAKGNEEYAGPRQPLALDAVARHAPR